MSRLVEVDVHVELRAAVAGVEAGRRVGRGGRGVAARGPPRARARGRGRRGARGRGRRRVAGRGAPRAPRARRAHGAHLPRRPAAQVDPPHQQLRVRC